MWCPGDVKYVGHAGNVNCAWSSNNVSSMSVMWAVCVALAM